LSTLGTVVKTFYESASPSFSVDKIDFLAISDTASTKISVNITGLQSTEIKFTM